MTRMNQTLRDVCNIEIGRTPSRGKATYWDKAKSTNNIWLSIADMNNTDEDGNIFDSREYLSDSGADQFSAVPAGTLLMSFKLTIGRLAFAGQELRTNEAIAAITPKDPKKLDKRFLYYFLMSHDWDQVAGADVKVKGKTLNKQKIGSLPIYVPSMEDQTSVVAQLDSFLAQIRELDSKIDRKSELSELFYEAQIAEKVAGSVEKYGASAMGEIFTIARGGSPRPIKSFITNDSDGVNWIKIGDATRSGKYIDTTREKIKPSGVSRSRRVHSGDLLLSNSMSFGRPYILKTDGCIHDGWVVLTSKMEVDSEYAYYVLGSSYMKSQFETLAQGSTVQNLNIELISRALMPVPSISEQLEMVEAFKVLEGLAQEYSKKQQDLQNSVLELRKAKLASLFEGAA